MQLKFGAKIAGAEDNKRKACFLSSSGSATLIQQDMEFEICEMAITKEKEQKKV